MPFGLFGKKEEKEELKDLGRIKSYRPISDKIASRGPRSPLRLRELPERPSREPSLPSIRKPEKPSFPEKPKFPSKPELRKPKPPKPEVKKISLKELPLKNLSKKIDEELEEIKKEFKDIGKTKGLTLESPELIDLLNLYVNAKKKMNTFIDEINEMNLSRLTSKRTVAAVYKFRACKAISDIKKEVKKIDKICKKAGFIPLKVHDILESSAEDIVNSFLKKEKKKK